MIQHKNLAHRRILTVKYQYLLKRLLCQSAYFDFVEKTFFAGVQQQQNHEITLKSVEKKPKNKKMATSKILSDFLTNNKNKAEINSERRKKRPKRKSVNSTSFVFLTALSALAFVLSQCFISAEASPFAFPGPFPEGKTRKNAKIKPRITRFGFAKV